MVLTKIESRTGRERHEKLKERTIQFLECIVQIVKSTFFLLMLSGLLNQLLFFAVVEIVKTSFCYCPNCVIDLFFCVVQIVKIYRHATEAVEFFQRLQNSHFN